MKINSITRPDNLRSKRIFDLLISFIGLCISPVLIWFFEQKKQFLLNLLSVFKGEISIVGYCIQESKDVEKTQDLPSLKRGLLNPLSGNTVNDPKLIDQVNINYAKEYSIIKDLRVLIKKWTYLDF
jgi:lipopolysaccharide/colanic/teichoic acid biosynthesis glycosyltransferase